MKPFLFACVIVAAVPVSAAFAQPLPFPNQPIPFDDSSYQRCKTSNFLEGPNDCVTLQPLGEPAVPVSEKETKLAFRLVWGRGDARNEAIVLRFELQSEDSGLLFVHQTRGPFEFVEGKSLLTSDDVEKLLRAEAKANFWALKEEGDFDSIKHANGVEEVMICYDGLSIAGVKTGSQRVVRRDCPMRTKGDSATEFARTLLKVARKHFPDIAADKYFWSDVL